MNDRRFYLDRAAEFGQDDRTGNLSLWFAIEMERLARAVVEPLPLYVQPDDGNDDRHP